MDCENCGAPMTLYGDQDMFYCEFCGSFRFPSESSDGIRVLGLADGDAACPVCHGQLLNASVDGLKGLHCDRCKGLLIDRASFREVVDYRRMRAKGPPDPPRPLNRGLLERQVRCPLCDRIMNTHPYYGPGNIAIDTCSHCEIIWLDRAELGTITGAPGRDRGKVTRPGGHHLRMGLPRSRKRDGGAG